MKRRMGIALLLSAMCLIFSASTAGAVKFYGCQFNEPTFETLEETRLSGPEAIKELPSNQGKVFVSHPVLDGYPEGTTFVYRSANMYGDRAAARMNTNLLVFAQKHFENKENAETYLRELGLIDIADHSIGSVVLVTPADGEAFGQADQTNYYKLQTAMLAQKAGGKDAEGNEVSYSDAEYYGGYGYLYVIGIDEGATFLNNYVASTFDYSSRIAGMLLINGDMERIRQVASLVPTYLVNADTAILTKYQKANNTNAYYRDADDEVFFNQELPLQKVIVARDGNRTNADYIKHAYYEYFVKAMRVPVIKAGLYTAATPYQGGAFDEAPYSLCDRNAIFDGKTEDGIYLFSHVDDTFKDIVSSNGDFMETWFEYLPEEVLNNTAAPGSIPLVLANHGGGDDPRLFVDEIGLLSLAGKERFAVVAAEHQSIYGGFFSNGAPSILPQALPALVHYMLDKYPALDASRVYTTGYSLGGGATFMAIYGEPSVFAAAVPMASAGYEATEEQIAQFEKYDLPIMFTTSSFDLPGAFTPATTTISEAYQGYVNTFLAYNGIDKKIEYDFETYPISGFEGDRYTETTLNGEYQNMTWLLDNADGVPMVGISYTQDLVHALYPEYAKVFWNFVKHYSRNQETGAIEYTEFVK